MPQRIPLLAVPNQSLALSLEGLNYALAFRTTRGQMSVTVSINEVILVSNARVLSDAPIIPYPYLEGSGGNFIITTEFDALPEFAEFDVTQFLFYLTAAEVADAR